MNARFLAASSLRWQSSHLTRGICLPRCVKYPVSLVAIAILASFMPSISRAADGGSLSTAANASPSNIVIGFVGGFVSHEDVHHGPVQFAQRLQRSFPNGTYIRVFENRRRKQAYKAILHLLDTNRDGVLSAEEKARARIVLFGHSWGAASAVVLARDLRRKGVPVLLTVQVDSVAKMWQNDSVIPDNVAAAVNFYQPHGILHGRPEITAANPEKTQILGNYKKDYRKDPIHCPEASRTERFLTPGHVQCECDPGMWSQIETLVRDRLSLPEPASTASAAVTP
jgi:pimeloyl-ACP methyl ester carboxylesterase